MLTDQEIRTLLIRYPDGVNKEIFRKTCHISPRMAQYLLESQLVPCEIKPQKSHRYAIATADMIAYLRDREKHPERYLYPHKHKNGQHQKRLRKRVHSRPSESQLRSISDAAYAQACLSTLEDCPDVMTIERARNTIGYSYKSYLNWYREKKLTCLRIRGQYFIPRIALYEFMLTEHFRGIRMKSDRHWEMLSLAVRIQSERKDTL